MAQMARRLRAGLKNRVPQVWRRLFERQVEHPVRHDLKSWASSHPGADFAILEPARTVIREPPKTIEHDVDASFAPLCEFPAPERVLVKIPNARIRGRYGLVVLPTDEFVGELIALEPDGQHRALRDEPAYYKPLLKRSTRKSGTFYALMGLGINNYTHFKHDIIMKWASISELLPEDTKFIVPASLAQFQRDEIDLVGLDSRRLVPFPSNETWELEALYVAVPIRKSPNDTPEHYEAYRRAAIERRGIRNPSPKRRLFLTRRHDAHRRLANEGDVISALSRYGFETIAPALLTLREQIDLFAQAEAIVGSGSGLTNMVYAPPGTKVLEFYERGIGHHAFWAMASALGLDYHFLLCNQVDNPGRAEPDLHLPIPALQQAIAQMALA
jgi:capsular polysaccharide biosynthesis protein